MAVSFPSPPPKKKINKCLDKQRYSKNSSCFQFMSLFPTKKRGGSYMANVFPIMQGDLVRGFTLWASGCHQTWVNYFGLEQGVKVHTPEVIVFLKIKVCLASLKFLRQSLMNRTNLHVVLLSGKLILLLAFHQNLQQTEE